MSSVSKSLLFIAIFSLTVFFLALFISGQYQIILTEPETGHHSFDQMVYLKTYYLMEQKVDYYWAHKFSVMSDIARRKLDSDVFTWRLPTIFYIWNLIVDNGLQILHLFWIMVFISGGAIYLLMYRIANKFIAGLSLIILSPYFYDTYVQQTSFLFIEWWAWFCLIIGLCAFIYKRLTIAYVFFLLALAIRELSVIPIFFMFLWSIIIGKNTKFFFSLLIVFVIFMMMHTSMIYREVGAKENLDFISTIFNHLHGFDRHAVMRTMSFLMREYPLVRFKSHFWLIIVSLIGSMKFIFINKNKHDYIYVLILGWSFLLVIPFIITSINQDYWGIIYIPTILMYFPLLFTDKVNIFEKLKQKVLGNK